MPSYSIKNKNILFIHIPKTGGTSVERALNSISSSSSLHGSFDFPGIPVVSQHYHFSVLAESLNLDNYDYTFTILRHPLNRFLSEINYRLSGGGFLKRYLQLFCSNKFIWFFIQVPIITYIFMRYFFNPYFLSNHIRPQSHFVSHSLDRVFLFENGFDSILHELSSYISIENLIFYHEKKGKKFVSNLNQFSLAVIKLFYKNDFILYNKYLLKK